MSPNRTLRLAAAPTWRTASKLAPLHSPFPIPHSPFHRAFTLVEMLTVIVIIGILASLATVGAFAALTAAKQARIQTEITNLESALEKYKMQYGEYPPSDMSNLPLVRRHLQKAFPRCNVTTELLAIPRRDGSFNGAIPAMTPAQALVFWLRGFSKDKQRPLSALLVANAEREPILDIDKTRLIDPVTKEVWVASLTPLFKPEPVYQAPYGEQPFVYFEWRSYLWHAVNNLNDPDPIARVRLYLLQPWDKTPGNGFLTVGIDLNDDVPLNPSGEPDSAAFAKLCANPKSFQLISAGLDGDFGIPPDNTTYKTNVTIGPDNYDLYYKSFPDGLGYVEGDNDNLVNFSERALEDAKP